MANETKKGKQKLQSILQRLVNNPVTGINEKVSVQNIKFENEKKILEKCILKLIPLENPYKPIIKKDLHVSFTKTSRRRYIILTVLGESREKAASSFYKRTILLIKLDKDCRQRKLKANFISDHLCLKQNFCIHAKTSSGRKFLALSVTRH